MTPRRTTSDPVETGKACVCGDLHTWDAVRCHCGRLLVQAKPAATSVLNEPGTRGGEHPTRTPDAVCPFPNAGQSLSHGGELADPGSLNTARPAA